MTYQPPCPICGKEWDHHCIVMPKQQWQPSIIEFAAGDELLILAYKSYAKYGLDGPPPGSNAMSLRHGFYSSKPGVRLVVGELLIQKTVPPYIQLTASKDHIIAPIYSQKFLVRKENWWREICVVEDEDLEIADKISQKYGNFGFGVEYA